MHDVRISDRTETKMSLKELIGLQVCRVEPLVFQTCYHQLHKLVTPVTGVTSLLPAVHDDGARMSLVVQTHFSTKWYNWPGKIWHAVIRPSGVVKVFHMSAVGITSDLECADYKVGCLFCVHQSDSNVTVDLLLARRLRPVQLTLRLNNQQPTSIQSLRPITTHTDYISLHMYPDKHYGHGLCK